MELLGIIKCNQLQFLGRSCYGKYIAGLQIALGGAVSAGITGIAVFGISNQLQPAACSKHQRGHLGVVGADRRQHHHISGGIQHRAARLTGRSARDLGSGNPGMANIMATLGKGPGFAVLAGDVAKTVLACGLCWLLAGPVLGHTALLYAGAGAISGHNCSLWHKGWGGKGVAVTCTWLILYLPVTGALCCLAGGLAVLGLGYLPLGAVLIPTLAVPIAWVQYGPESGIILLLAAAMMFWRHKNGLHRIFLGQEKQFFRPKS